MKAASVFCICFHDIRRSRTDAKLISQAGRFKENTYRAVRLGSLHTAGVVVLNAATGFSLQVFVSLDEADNLGVLMHAGGELGPQMDQVFLKGCGK